MRALVLSTIAAVAVWGTAAFGQDEGMGMHQDGRGVADGIHHGFVDANGDGVNDLALDADGDGTPNGMDPDYVLPPGSESGRGRMGGMMGNAVGTGSTVAGQPAAGTQNSALAQHQAPNTTTTKADMQQEGSAKQSRTKAMGRGMGHGSGAHGR